MLVDDFHLKASRYYMLIFGFILYASIVIVITLTIPLWLKLALIAVVLVHGSRVFWRYALLRDKLSITTIRHTSEKRWVVQNREGTFAADLHPNSTVTSILMVLQFRVPGRVLPLKSVIFRDSLAKDDYRKLLVLLNQ